MYEFYSSPIPESKIKRLKKDLKNLYSDIPETEGCMENIAKPDGCSSWCCQVQNPQVTFAEFLNSWSTIKSSWKKEQITELLQRAVSNSLTQSFTKGCVFWNKDSKLCNQHHTRPFNCRTYSQIPDEEFKPRFERLKVLYPQADLREQCKLTRTIGRKPSKEDLDEWFVQLKFIEHDIGIDLRLMNDNDGGSYRTYHDHLLLYLGSDGFLNILTKMKTKSSEEERNAFIAKVPEKITTYFPKLKW